MSSLTNAVLPVLISGAGPSGLLVALALAKNGIAIRIVEKSPTYHNTERGSGLVPRTLEAFNLLGLLPDIQKGGKPSPLVQLYKLPGGTEVIKSWHMSSHKEPIPSIPWPNALIHGQQMTEAVLRSHLEKYGVRVELGTELRSFTQDDDGVTAQIVKTNDGEETAETVRAHWLVGADGARGVVRKQLNLKFLGETRDNEQLSVLADVQLSGLDREHWHVWGEPSSQLLVIRPTERDDDSFWIAATGNIDHARLVASREEFLNHVRKVSNRDDIKIGKIKHITEWRPNVRMVDKFADGRVFVVGDAAHVHSPTGGQGLNSSIQDSLNLAWKLALVEKGLSPSSVLSTYTSERLPVIAEMLKRTTILLDKTLASKENGFNVDAWKRDGELSQLGVNYRWSEIVVDERSKDKDSVINAYGTAEGGSLRAGDRAPEAPALQDVSADTDALTSLFRIFSPVRHTALIFTDKPSEISPVLDALNKYPEGTVSAVLILPQAATSAQAVNGVKTVLRDTEGHAYTGYGVAETGLTVVIVRPDGVVGAIVYGAPGVERYRRLIFSDV